jgi:hypothetical protein
MPRPNDKETAATTPYPVHVKRPVMRCLFLLLTGVSVMLCLGACSKQPDIPPRVSYPGYRAQLIFHEDFSQDLTSWAIDGLDESVAIQEGRLVMVEPPEGQGLAAWILRDFSGDFQLEYEVEIPETAGINTVILCAHGAEGQDVLADLPSRTGKLNDYIHGSIRSYHISYHCYGADGQHDPGSKIRKNPGHMLLSRGETDPCQENRRYLIDILKFGNRILFMVDGIVNQDIRDMGGFEPVYQSGKIGFWIHGAGGTFKTFIDNVRVYRLKPE